MKIAAALALLAVSCGDGRLALAPDPCAGSTMELPSCSLGCTMADIEQMLFKPKCFACHGRVTLYPTTLDLESDGLAARVVDQPAEDDPDKGKCAGKILVPRQDPLGSFFVEKVESPTPSCGIAMPQNAPPLGDDEIACVKRWALLAAQGTPPTQ